MKLLHLKTSFKYGVIKSDGRKVSTAMRVCDGGLYRNALFNTLLFFVLIFPFSGVSGEVKLEPLSALMEQARHDQLWKESEWLNLLHYHSDPLWGLRSHVKSADFFISEDGRVNSQKELEATLKAFFLEGDGDQLAQCRYVARFHWLKEKLAISDAILPQHTCIAFLEWRNKINPGSVTLVFPGAYLNAPSSMFGHTLLRIDPPFQQNTRTSLLSYSVNFAAMLPNEVGSVEYVYGGIMGAFPGRFVISPYYEKIKEYGHIENRDIWEYSLNLSLQEVDRLIQHLWEVRDEEFYYFFADENCSYRLLELLEVARPGASLTDDFVFYAIPVDTIRLLEDKGFVSSVQFRPSSATKLQAEINRLTDQEKDLAISVSRDTSAMQSQAFLSLHLDRQAYILQTAFRYLRWEAEGDGQDISSVDRSFQMVKRLSGLPTSKSADINSPVTPDKGHETSRLSLFIGKEDKPYLQFGFRPLYHGLIDSQPGYSRGTEIAFSNMEFRLTEASFFLHQFDLLRIDSLRPIDMFIKPISWRLRMGLERTPVSSGYHLISQINGGAGLSLGIFSEGLVYALPSVRVEYHPDLSRHRGVAVGISIGALWYTDWGTTHVEWMNHYFFDGGQIRHHVFLRQNIAINRNQAVRIGIEYKETYGFGDFNAFLGCLFYL